MLYSVLHISHTWVHHLGISFKNDSFHSQFVYLVLCYGCGCWQLAQLEHKNSVLESENQTLHSRLEGPRPAEKSTNVSLNVMFDMLLHITCLTFAWDILSCWALINTEWIFTLCTVDFCALTLLVGLQEGNLTIATTIHWWGLAKIDYLQKNWPVKLNLKVVVVVVIAFMVITGTTARLYITLLKTGNNRVHFWNTSK